MNSNENEKKNEVSPYEYKAWYLGSKLHREDGPAVIFPDGTKKWYVNNQLHREDGPAIIFHKNRSWWLNFSFYTQKEWFEELIRRSLE